MRTPGEGDDEGAKGGGAQGFAENLEAEGMGTLSQSGGAIGSDESAGA